MPFKRLGVLALGLLALVAYAHPAAADRFIQQRSEAFLRYQSLVKWLKAAQDTKGWVVLEACRQEFSDGSVPPDPDSGDWADVEGCYLKGTQPRFAEALARPGVKAGTNMRALCSTLAREQDVRLFYDCYYDHLTARRHFVSLVKKGSESEREQCAVDICGDVYAGSLRRSMGRHSRSSRSKQRKSAVMWADTGCFPEPPSVSHSYETERRWLEHLAEDKDEPSSGGITARRCLEMAKSASPGIGESVGQLATECYAVARESTVSLNYEELPAKTRDSAMNYCRSRSNGNVDDYASCLSDQFVEAHRVCQQLVMGEGGGALASISTTLCRARELLAGRGSAIEDWQALLWCGMPQREPSRRERPNIHDFPILDFPMIGPFGQTEFLTK